MIGVVCLGLDEESSLNDATLRELLIILTEINNSPAKPLTIAELIELKSPLDIDAVVLVDSMPSDGDWNLALSARKHLDTTGIKVVGSPLDALISCRDKVKTREILRREGLPVPIGGRTTARMRAHIPLVVKPRFGSASTGVKYLATGDGWSIPRRGKFDEWIWEDFIPGTEVTVSVIRKEGSLSALPPIEIEVLDREIYDYETKVVTEANRLHLPARLPPETLDLACKLAVRAAAALNVGYVARVDIRFRGSEPYILDVNAEPTLHSDDFVSRSLAAVGLTIRDLLGFAIADLA